jgi:hypothetical protein
MDIVTICNSLRFNANLKSYEILTNGNINTTYHVVTNDGKKRYEYLFK